MVGDRSKLHLPTHCSPPPDRADTRGQDNYCGDRAIRPERANVARGPTPRASRAWWPPTPRALQPPSRGSAGHDAAREGGMRGRHRGTRDHDGPEDRPCAASVGSAPMRSPGGLFEREVRHQHLVHNHPEPSRTICNRHPSHSHQAKFLEAPHVRQYKTYLLQTGILAFSIPWHPRTPGPRDGSQVERARKREGAKSDGRAEREA